MSTPFDNENLRNWLLEGCELATLLPNRLGTVGTGPFPESEFVDFLSSLGLEISTPSQELSVLVMGREEWDEDSLHEVIEGRRGMALRVYSQEMVLAYMLVGRDPLDSPEIAESFGDGHPALEYIKEWGWDWPKTRLVPHSAERSFGPVGVWKAESFLTIMGYTVGTKRRDLQMRRDALRHTFTEELPAVSDDKYRAEWGPPQSGTRLKKMAERISLNILLHYPQGHQVAVSRWTGDLDWLRRVYYDGHYTFPWPSTIV